MNYGLGEEGRREQGSDQERVGKKRDRVASLLFGEAARALGLHLTDCARNLTRIILFSSFTSLSPLHFQAQPLNQP